MRLIIKDYLRTLREKDQLDLLLCDLLRSSGFIIDSVPKTGNRQYGVDIQAHSKAELYLFVVKQKNIDRNTWDSGQNSVRQSMDEILDVYLGNLSPQDKTKRITIVVATNGDLEESARINFYGYQNLHQEWNRKKIDIQFWGIDKITAQVQEKLFSEALLPEQMQSQLRKALYYVEEQDYKRAYYETVVDSYIEHLMGDGSACSKEANRKTLASLLLCTSMIAKYAADVQRYRISALVFEYATIRLWKWMLQNNNMQKRFYSEWVISFYKKYIGYNLKYYDAIKSVCVSPNGFLSYYSIVEQKIKLYEVIGQLSSFAYGLHFSASKKEREKAIEILNVVKQLINNNSQYYYAPYDENIAQVTMLLRALIACGDSESVKGLITNQVTYTKQWYLDTKKYPTPIDSFKDAINIELGNAHEEYTTSAFWGFMLLWIALLNDKKCYDGISGFLGNELRKVTKCLWFLRSDEELLLLEKNTMYRAGDGIVIEAEQDYDTFRKKLLFIADQYKNEVFSYEKYSFPAMELMASHYFGTIPRVITY